MAYGTTDTTTMYIEDSVLGEAEYTNYLLFYTITKRINNLWYADLTMVDIGSDQRDYVKKGNTCKIFSNSTLILKGIIKSVKYDSFNQATVYIEGTCSQMKESITNTTYTNTDTSTIVSGLAADAGFNLGSNVNYGLVTVSFDNENDLRGIHDLAETVGYYWWEDWGAGSPYGTNTINFGPTYGSAGSTYSFNASGVSQNIEGTNKEIDIDKQANYVIALGYGDGINQLKSEVFDATNTRTTLGSPFGLGSPVLYLSDTTNFTPPGSAFVGMEMMGYTGSSVGSLTGITSGLGYLGNVVQSYVHDAGIPVWDAQYTESSPESSSSIDTYGTIQKRFTDKRIIDQNALDIFAAKILTEKTEPVEMITLTTTEYRDVLDSVSLGDLVGVEDSESTLSGNYKVVGMIFGFSKERGEYLDLELSNRKDNFVDQIAKLEQDTERVNVYMQGATNIYAISEAENCDTSNNLHMRFFVPPEAVSINSVNLNFKMKDYRYYTTSTPVGAGSTVVSSRFYDSAGVGEILGNSIVSKTEFTGTWVDTSWRYLGGASGSLTLGSEVDYAFAVVNIAAVAENSSVGAAVYAYVYSDSYPNDDAGVAFNIGDGDRTIVIPIPNPINSEKVRVLGKMAAGSAYWVGDWYLIGMDPHYHIVNTPAHAHAMSPAISTQAVSNGSFGLWIGEDGAGSSLKEWYSGDRTNIDITPEVRTIGSNKWVDLQFSPNQNMRIESNAYVQMFIKSI